MNYVECLKRATLQQTCQDKDGAETNPPRTIAFANISGMTSGLSDNLISSSRSTSTRFQSVLDTFEEEGLLMVIPAAVALRAVAKRYASSNGIPTCLAASLSCPSNTAK